MDPRPSYASTARFLREMMRKEVHTPAVADCAHCNLNYAAAALERLAGSEFTGMTPWDIAEGWYTEDQIARSIEQSGSRSFGAWEKIPEDVRSPEFAKWLTHQYRLAMAKGIQLGRG